MTRRAGIILQARMASRRLPGKALERIGKHSILELCLNRLTSSNAAPVVLATTEGREDDALAAVASAMGVAVFRGASADVLDRFLRCADCFGIDLIVRATADNPGVDPGAPVRILSAMRETGVDYVCEVGLPLGGAVEGVTREALETTAAQNPDAYDREHVTSFVRRRGDLFRQLQLGTPLELTRPEVRVTVDTPNDLQYMRNLYRATGGEMPSLLELIAAADRSAPASVA